MIIGKAAGIDVITIARKGLSEQFIPPRVLACGYCYLVFPELINRNTKMPPGLYSDCTFQVANRKSFLRLLLVFIVLICPIFSSFSFVNGVFLRGREISPSYNLLTSEGHVLLVTLQASSHSVAVSRPTGIRRCA
jgi:hypothetical protein